MVNQIDLSTNLDILNLVVTKLWCLYPADSVDDLMSVPLVVAKKILQTAQTLKCIIENDHDYFISQAVMRILADSVTAFVIVYGCKDSEEMAIRHYLYTLDGIRQHKKDLEDKLKYIAGDTLSAIQIRRDLKEAIHRSQNLIEQCDNGLDRIKKRSQWSDTIEVLKKNSYWRFVSLMDVDKEIKRKKGTKSLQKISWKSLYERVFNDDITNFFSSELSQFVHGMANAYISYDYSTETGKLLSDISSEILNKMALVLINIYAEEFSSLNINKNNL